jgi:hypothetical protein
MRATVDLLDAAFEALDAQPSDDAVARLSLVTSVKFYALQRLSSEPAAESAGNGRVECLYRLAKFGVRSFEQIPQALAPRGLAIFS